MFRIDTPDATPNNMFTEGNPTIPIEATTVSADWLNSIQEELMSILEHAEIIPDKTTTSQVRDSIEQMIARRRIPIATESTPGIICPDKHTLTIDTKGLLSVKPIMAEFRDFFEITPPPGWAIRDGSTLEEADVKFPQLWEHLCHDDNAWKCVPSVDWERLSNNARGIGGVAFFVVDQSTKTIKLPDTRTDHGFGTDPIHVGTWHNDAIRNITGSIDSPINYGSHSNGALYTGNYAAGVHAHATGTGYHALLFSASRSVPTADQVRPRRIGLLPCVYVGGI